MSIAVAVGVETEAVEYHKPLNDEPEPTLWSRFVLYALQAKHIYGGTVPETEIRRRRAKGRVARRSRRANR